MERMRAHMVGEPNLFCHSTVVCGYSDTHWDWLNCHLDVEKPVTAADCHFNGVTITTDYCIFLFSCS